MESNMDSMFSGQWKGQRPEIRLAELQNPGLYGAAFVVFRSLG